MATNERPVVLVTGATDGLGLSIARKLAAADETDLVLHGRRQDALDALVKELSTQSVGRVCAVCADFTDLASVAAASEVLAAKLSRLDVLINNAGIGEAQPDSVERAVTRDGHELRLAVNYLGPALLTLNLLPLLSATADSRIVNVASIGQREIDFDNIELERGYTGNRAYCQSKLALIMFGFMLASQFGDVGPTVNSLHPGTYMPTKIVMESVGFSIDSLENGTEATLRLARGPELQGVTGQYFDGVRQAQANPQAYRADDLRRLYEKTLELLQDYRIAS